MVQPQQNQKAAQNEQHNAPRTNIGVEHRRAPSREVLVKPTREPHKTARGDQFGQIVERTLPADIFRLGSGVQFRHIDPVGGDVMRSSAESNDCKDRDRYREERRQVKGQGRSAEQYAAQKLRRNDEELLCLEQFQKGTPQKLDCPRPHNQGGPERDLGVRNTQILEHHSRNHVQHDERQAHRKIERRDPA